MDEKLKLAADKIEIADVVYKYCRAIDRMDRELLESVFHEDSIHHHGEYEGPSSDFCNFAFDILFILWPKFLLWQESRQNILDVKRPCTLIL